MTTGKSELEVLRDTALWASSNVHPRNLALLDFPCRINTVDRQSLSWTKVEQESLLIVDRIRFGLKVIDLVKRFDREPFLNGGKHLARAFFTTNLLEEMSVERVSELLEHSGCDEEQISKGIAEVFH